MAESYKRVCVAFIVIQTLVVQCSTYDIYRGNRDNFRRGLVENPPKSCRKNEQYCSCEDLETFTYDDIEGTGKCVKNYESTPGMDCTRFSNHAIELISESSPIQVNFNFNAVGPCRWKRTQFSVTGDNDQWWPTQNNPGIISVYHVFGTAQGLQVNDPSTVQSKFAGNLLKIGIECNRPFTFPPKFYELCLVLKVEGRTNITTIQSTPSLTPSTTTKTSITSPTTPTLNSSVEPENERVTTNSRSTTIKTSKSPLTTAFPSNGKQGESEGEEDSRNLLPIFLPIILLFVLVLVLLGVFIYRRRSTSKSTESERDLEEDSNTLPHHATLTRKPQDPSQFYAVPGTQINTIPVYDNVDETAPRKPPPNYYELEGEYATVPDKGRDTADGTERLPTYTNPTTDGVYQDVDFNTGSFGNSRDNLGQTDSSNVNLYSSAENIYDRVTEEPNEPFYNVLEEPN